MGEKVCPVVAAIREIKGSAEYKKGGSAVIGGNEYCFDNVMFLYNIRKMELARLELSRPDLVTLRARPYKYGTFRDIAAEIGAQTGHLRAIELAGAAIGAFFAALAAKISRSRAANVTIPHIDLGGRPTSSDEITQVVNNMVKFINGVNVNSLLRQPRTTKITPLDPPQLAEIDLDTPIGVDTATATSPDEIITALKAALAAEEAVYIHAASVERFHCAAAAKIAEVTAAVDEMIALLKPAPITGVN